MHAGAAPLGLTSLPLEIFHYFGGWWDVFYACISVAIFIYKGLTLPYPPGSFAVEFTFLWIFMLVEPVRLFLGSKGNKTEQSPPLVFSFLLAAPVVAFWGYCLRFQTYVLKVDVVLNSISLAFCGVQVLLGGIQAARFIQAAQYA